VIAGRVLRPLRTITAAAREISATNLSRRLALTGADDELKELGDTFDGLLARLETAFAAQRQFVANASHELRSPLTRQQALIQVTLADPEASVGSLRAAHERVLVSGHQQQRLIDALLALARGQAGLHQAETVDLSAVVAQVLALRESELQARGVAVHSNLSSAFVVGDRRLLEQLVTNIVDNAAHHNNADGQLMVATAVGQDRCVLTVSNTGPVVPAEEVARLLRPFQRMGAERTGPGLGLGLSIVEAIAMAHGADLAVLPRPTGGLHVSVSFVRFAQPRSTGTRALAAATT
jgi:signal transduction histidine kinase